MIRCVAPNASIDRVFVTERLVQGTIHRPSLAVTVAGGKGLNVARSLACLGQPASVAAVLAGHAGRWIRDELARIGVPGRYVWVGGETRTCLSVVTDDDHGRATEFNERGPDVSPAAWARFVRMSVADAEPGSWLALSGSLPPGAPTDGYRVLAGRAQRRGWLVALDSHGSALAAAMDASPALLKINLAEARELVDGPRLEVEDVGHAIHVRLPEAVVAITLGTEGALIVLPDGRAWRGRVDAVGRYPVGSGDAFLGGLLAGHAAGRSWPDAFRVALGAAAANAEEPGAGRLDGHRAEQLAAESTITTVPW